MPVTHEGVEGTAAIVTPRLVFFSRVLPSGLYTNFAKITEALVHADLFEALILQLLD
jgi:hypothetical protein